MVPFLIVSMLPVLVLALVLRPHAAQVPSVIPTRAPSRAPSSAAPVKGVPSAPPTPSPTLPWARGAGNDGYGTGHAALPTQIGLQYNASSWYFTTGGPIYSTPAIGATGTIYVLSNDSYLYALNASGSYLWSVQVPDPYTSYGYYSSPVLSPGGDTVYVGSESGFLMAVTAATGQLAWLLTLGNGNQIVDGTAVAAKVGGATTVFVCSYASDGTSSGALTAVTDQGTSAAVRWVFAPSWGSCYSAPAVDAAATYVYAIFLSPAGSVGTAAAPPLGRLYQVSVASPAASLAAGAQAYFPLPQVPHFACDSPYLAPI
jgi:hypothetical protein